jgi:hypothetical protein
VWWLLLLLLLLAAVGGGGGGGGVGRVGVNRRVCVVKIQKGWT